MPSTLTRTCSPPRITDGVTIRDAHDGTVEPIISLRVRQRTGRLWLNLSTLTTAKSGYFANERAVGVELKELRGGGHVSGPVELLIRHPVQLLWREMHVLMQVLVLLGSREPEMLHEQLQRLELVCPVTNAPDTNTIIAVASTMIARRQQNTSDIQPMGRGSIKKSTTVF